MDFLPFFLLYMHPLSFSEATQGVFGETPPFPTGMIQTQGSRRSDTAPAPSLDTHSFPHPNLQIVVFDLKIRIGCQTKNFCLVSRY